MTFVFIVIYSLKNCPGYGITALIIKDKDKKMKMLFTSLVRSVLSKSVPYVLRIMNIKY